MKILIKLLTLLAVLCAVACSQTFENESNSNLFSNQNAKAKGQLAMNIAKASRTITNILTNTDIHSAELTANGEVVGNWSGENVINQIESDSSIILDVGVYDFVLSVKNEADKTLATAQTHKTISGGRNNISFYLESVATGTGSFEVTFSWQSEDVSSVKAGLYNCETAEEIEGYEAAALTISGKTAVYAKEEVPVGQYMLMVKFYDGSDNLLKSYTEVLQVEVYGKTTATKTFAGFNTVHSVAYVLPAGKTWKENFTPVTNRKIFEAVELPTIENINTENDISVYTLKWYTTETFDVGTEIVKINAGTEKDMTVYAKIDDCCRTTVEGFVDTITGLEDGGPYNVIVTGELTAEALTTMVSSMNANSAKMINLDLSGTTGLTSIGEDAFYNCRNLTSVVIPDSVISIGEGAFGGCSSLSSVVIPDSVTSIDKNAFSACSGLTSVAIPGSVTSIGNYAFCNCSSLTSIEVDSANPVFSSSADGKMLLSKDKTTLIEYPSAVGEVTIPAGVSIINSCAFENNSNITSVVIPEGVTSIGDYTFGGCENLTSVTIPDSVTSIGNSAFYYCDSLESVHIFDLEAWCNIEFSGNPLSNGAKLYLNGSPVTDLVIPNGVESINSYAFSGCSSLTSVTLPDSVTSIGFRAFSSCDSLTSVTIGDSVTSIGTYAFDFCSSLTSVVIPDSVTSIGDFAFNYCSSLTSVTIGKNVSSIGYRAFFYCGNLASVTFKNTNNWYYTNRYNTNYTDGTAVDVTNPAQNAVYLRDDYSNYSWYSIELSDDGNIVFNKDKTELISYSNASGDITIPDGVKKIRDGAFENCSGLTSVTLPNSVTSIGNNAFLGCDSLESVHISDLTAWCNIEFADYSANPLDNGAKLYLNGSPVTDLVIPNGVESINSYAFTGSGLTSVTIGDSVTSIGNGAFSYCDSLTSVVIPDSVTSIGEGTFRGCSSLSSVAIPDSVTSIGDIAFYGCDSLESVHISDLAAWSNIEFADSSANPLWYGAKLYLNGDLAEFTVTFDVTGGILTGEARQTVTSGGKVVEPDTPFKTGYGFCGWYTSTDGGQTLDSAYNFDTVLTKNITLYAKWIDETVGYIAYSDGTISADYDSTKRPVGIVIEATDGTATKIVSLAETSAQWSTEDVDTNATSETDGMANMTAIQSISGWEEKYPAFKWCDEYTDASDNSEWYLPAKDELEQLYSVKEAVNAAIEKITAGDGTATSFGTGHYWSSSQYYGNFEAWTQSFSAGDQYGNPKDIARSVRAVRAF